MFLGNSSLEESKDLQTGDFLLGRPEQCRAIAAQTPACRAENTTTSGEAFAQCSHVLRAIFVILIFLSASGSRSADRSTPCCSTSGSPTSAPRRGCGTRSLYSTLKLSFVTGLVLLVSTLLSGARWRFDIRTLFLLLFVMQDAVSTFASPYFDWAILFWPDFIKCVMITYLITVLVDDRQKLRTALWVIALSIGIEAAKQGWAQFILDPGGKNLNGVTVFGDENETAVGLFMLIPIFGALAATTTKRWENVYAPLRLGRHRAPRHRDVLPRRVPDGDRGRRSPTFSDRGTSCGICLPSRS